MITGGRGFTGRGGGKVGEGFGYICIEEEMKGGGGGMGERGRGEEDAGEGE